MNHTVLSIASLIVGVVLVILLIYHNWRNWRNWRWELRANEVHAGNVFALPDNTGDVVAVIVTETATFVVWRGPK